MPAVRPAEGEPPDTDPSTPVSAADAILDAERAYLLESRSFLQLMRDDVLSLQALGGDPVSEEYLKAELYHRAEALADLPDTPLFFGRLDYAAGESFHIGRRHVHDPAGTPVVIDWRGPGARPAFPATPAPPHGARRRPR